MSSYHRSYDWWSYGKIVVVAVRYGGFNIIFVRTRAVIKTDGKKKPKKSKKIPEPVARVANYGGGGDFIDFAFGRSAARRGNVVVSLRRQWRAGQAQCARGRYTSTTRTTYVCACVCARGGRGVPWRWARLACVSSSSPPPPPPSSSSFLCPTHGRLVCRLLRRRRRPSVPARPLPPPFMPRSTIATAAVRSYSLCDCLPAAAVVVGGGAVGCRSGRAVAQGAGLSISSETVNHSPAQHFDSRPIIVRTNFLEPITHTAHFIAFISSCSISTPLQYTVFLFRLFWFSIIL